MNKYRLIYLGAETNIHTANFYLHTFIIELTLHVGFLVADYSTYCAYFPSSEHIIKVSRRSFVYYYVLYILS